MPPKRKASSAATKSEGTASSGRRAPARGKAAAVKATSDDETGIEEIEPPKKKTRVARKKADTTVDDDAESGTSDTKKKGGRKPSKAESAKKTPKAIDELDPATYTDARALALFEEYVDNEAPDDEPTISPEGLMRLCEAADMPMEGVRPVLLAWVCKARKMGNVYKSEWMNGMGLYRIDTIPKLALAMSELDACLFSDVTPTSSPSKKDPYNRQAVVTLASQAKSKPLKDLYFFVFTLSRQEGQRNIDIDTAVALWDVVLKPRFSVIGDLIAYITEANGPDREEGQPPKMYKGVTKDQWSMTWQLVTTVKPDLSDYDTDGGWPTLFDEFVAWKKAQ